MKFGDFNATICNETEIIQSHVQTMFGQTNCNLDPFVNRSRVYKLIIQFLNGLVRFQNEVVPFKNEAKWLENQSNSLEVVYKQPEQHENFT